MPKSMYKRAGNKSKTYTSYDVEAEIPKSGAQTKWNPKGGNKSYLSSYGLASKDMAESYAKSLESLKGVSKVTVTENIDTESIRNTISSVTPKKAKPQKLEY